MPAFSVIDRGLCSYTDAHAEMLALLRERLSGVRTDTLLVCEHPPVLTIGRQGSRANIRVAEEALHARGIDVIDVERGGDITFHGPGQLVAYPIFTLPAGRRNVKMFIRSVEQALVRTCRHFGAPACTIAGLTGVWIGPDDRGEQRTAWDGECKVASLGFAFKAWTSYHGIALNVACDLTAFDLIHLCGLRGKLAINLSEAAKQPLTVAAVAPMFIATMRDLWHAYD